MIPDPESLSEMAARWERGMLAICARASCTELPAAWYVTDEPLTLFLRHGDHGPTLAVPLPDGLARGAYVRLGQRAGAWYEELHGRARSW